MGRACLVAAVVALATGVVVAQPAGSTDKQKQQAGELVRKAIAKSQAGDHATAIDLYLQAYAIVPLPILLSNVGSEYQQQGKPVEALRYFCKYIDADPTGTNVAYATAQAKSLQIEQGNQVDDKDVCNPPKPASPKPADHGEHGEHAEPAGAPPTSHEAAVTGGVDHPGNTLEYTGLGIGAAGVIALGVGTYFGVQAKKISDDISNHPINQMWRTDIRSYEAQGQSDQNKMIGFVIAGGALVASGAIMLYMGHSKNASAEHVAVMPVASPTTIGLAVGGGF
jgi:tetratricopeptide (TPR) repeat protein